MHIQQSLRDDYVSFHRQTVVHLKTRGTERTIGLECRSAGIVTLIIDNDQSFAPTLSGVSFGILVNTTVGVCSAC